MPPQAIIMGMPLPIIDIMRLQHSMNMSFEASSIGIISQTMPLAVILHVILHIIIGIMPPIGIIPPIIGIMLFMGIAPIIGMPFIIIGIMPFIIIGFIIGIMLFIIGMADICIAGFIVCSIGFEGRPAAAGRRWADLYATQFRPTTPILRRDSLSSAATEDLFIRVENDAFRTSGILPWRPI
jgi:hypothetical protein